MAGSSRASVGTYRDLVAWQKGMALAELTYRLTGAFPAGERFALAAQMKRAAASVPANLAEGFGRMRKGEFRRYVGISRGSLFELQTYAELARRLGWVAGSDLREYRDLMQEVDAILTGLARSQKE